jgi:hypothetical protein
MNLIPSEILNIICEYSDVNNIARLRASNTEMMNTVNLDPYFTKDSCDTVTIVRYCMESDSPDTNRILRYISSINDDKLFEMLIECYDHSGKTGLKWFFDFIFENTNDTYIDHLNVCLYDSKVFAKKVITDFEFGMDLIDTVHIDLSIVLRRYLRHSYFEIEFPRVVEWVERVFESDIKISNRNKIYTVFIAYTTLVLNQDAGEYYFLIESPLFESLLENLREVGIREIGPILVQTFNQVHIHTQHLDSDICHTIKTRLRYLIETYVIPVMTEDEFELV